MNYFDLHADTIYRMLTENKDFNNSDLHINSRFCGLFEKWYQCFAVFVDDKTAKPFDFYKNSLVCYQNNILKNGNSNFKPILTVENARIIENDIDRLFCLKKDGVFSITLTWNGENNIAGGAKSYGTLKPFGIKVIKRMNELKIATDISHLNDKSFYKIIEIADYPIATHSCFNEVFQHDRNINLEKLKFISEKNGIVGICLYKNFLGTENIFEGFYENVYLCLENGFENNLAVGSDFDGCESNIKVGDIPKLYEYLFNKGIPKKSLDKIFFKNAYNYLENFDKL